MKRTMPKLCWVMGVMAALLLLPSSVHAQAPISLAFDALPSAQGWTYFQGGDIPETRVFSVTGTSLIQNTIGTGFAHDPAENPNYALFGVVDGSKPFVLTVRARVLATEGPDSFGFAFAVRTASPNQIYGIGFSTSSVQDDFGNSVALDTTVFHRYVLQATPGGPFTLSIDGNVALTGPPCDCGGALNAITIGDGDNLSANAHAEITEYVFSQGGCGDERDSIIQEYQDVQFIYSWFPVPKCTDFVQTAVTPSGFYSFSATPPGTACNASSFVPTQCDGRNLNSSRNPLTGFQRYSWGLIRLALLNPASTGVGLDAWLAHAGTSSWWPLNSVYRNPAWNFTTGISGSPGSTAVGSRHMFGDAVDLRNVSRTYAEYFWLAVAAAKAGATWVEPPWGECGLGCVHADWRP